MSPARFATLRELLCISERDCARLMGMSPGGLRQQLQRGVVWPPFAEWLERAALNWRDDPPPRRIGKRVETARVKPAPAIDLDALREVIGTRPEVVEDRATRQRRIAEARAVKAGEVRSDALDTANTRLVEAPAKPARKRRKAGASA